MRRLSVCGPNCRLGFLPKVFNVTLKATHRRALAALAALDALFASLQQRAFAGAL